MAIASNRAGFALLERGALLFGLGPKYPNTSVPRHAGLPARAGGGVTGVVGSVTRELRFCVDLVASDDPSSTSSGSSRFCLRIWSLLPAIV
jgi:hypothetical protein